MLFFANSYSATRKLLNSLLLFLTVGGLCLIVCQILMHIPHFPLNVSVIQDLEMVNFVISSVVGEYRCDLFKLNRVK